MGASILAAFIITLFILPFFLVLLLIKNNITCRNQCIIAHAIFKHHKRHILAGNYDYSKLVDYEDMESYEKTLWRLWDWGYKRILPKEKYELVKEFIEKKEQIKND